MKKLKAEFYYKASNIASDFVLDIKLEFPSAGFTVITGDNGVGKTTFLNCVAGLIKPQQGFFELNNQVWNNTDKNIFLPPHKREIGYVFQTPYFFPHLSIKDNLLYGYKRLLNKNHTVSVEEIINFLNLNKILNKNLFKLSGGEKQRLAIGRALLSNPKILLMDEPLSSVDKNGKVEILNIFKTLENQLKIPILYVSHNIDEITYLSDNVVTLSETKKQFS